MNLNSSKIKFIIITIMFLFISQITISEEHSGLTTMLEKDEEICIICDTLASFPGGNNEMLNYLIQNIMYPSDDIRYRFSTLFELLLGE